uniref:ARAD1D22044p n=1 Tax=Blastobotrys adeninivorans TaxID=409370 RepID=A0A060T9V5_BLAAD
MSRYHFATRFESPQQINNLIDSVKAQYKLDPSSEYVIVVTGYPSYSSDHSAWEGQKTLRGDTLKVLFPSSAQGKLGAVISQVEETTPWYLKALYSSSTGTHVDLPGVKTELDQSVQPAFKQDVCKLDNRPFVPSMVCFYGLSQSMEELVNDYRNFVVESKCETDFVLSVKHFEPSLEMAIETIDFSVEKLMSMLNTNSDASLERVLYFKLKQKQGDLQTLLKIATQEQTEPALKKLHDTYMHHSGLITSELDNVGKLMESVQHLGSEYIDFPSESDFVKTVDLAQEHSSKWQISPVGSDNSPKIIPPMELEIPTTAIYGFTVPQVQYKVNVEYLLSSVYDAVQDEHVYALPEYRVTYSDLTDEGLEWQCKRWRITSKATNRQELIDQLTEKWSTPKDTPVILNLLIEHVVSPDVLRA